MGRRTAAVVFAAAMAASGALLISLTSRLTFLGDSWELLVRRSELSADSLLDPFHEHLILAPAIVYQLLLAAFGMDSALPFFVVSIGLFLFGAALLYVYLRRRVGDWLALAACLPVLFLGAASEDLLWEFQMTFFGAVAAGLGALLALDREDRRGDRAACLLLFVSMSFSGVGLAFAAAAVADLLCGRHPRRNRAYVALLPLATYLAWWAVWGQAGGGGIADPAQLPGDVFDAVAAGLSSLLGRPPVEEGGHPSLLARLLVVVLLVIAGLRTWRLRPPSRSLVVAATAALGFWVLISLDQGLTREPTSSRYQYPSVVLLLVLAAELVGRPPKFRLVLVAAAAISAAAVAGGLSMLRHEYDDFWRPTAEDTRSVLAAAELAGSSTQSDRRLRLPVDAIEFSVGEYASARARHGSPAFSEAELVRRSNRERQFADRAMAEVQALRLGPAAPGPEAGRCRSLSPGRRANVALPPGRLLLRGGSRPSELRLGRFADDFPVELGTLPPGATRTLSIPEDRARRAWRLAASGSPPRLCVQRILS
ncbi:MAG TPA: hypothetical protein VD741_09310 [Solirubrobacterales bacterium]|nr:hypothetical protein [Solirubrobacterales bacterium]